MKKRLCGALALVLIFSFLPMTSGAAEVSYSQVIRPQYEDASIFSEGLAAVKKDNRWGYIDENGKAVTDFKYDFASSFSEAKAIVGVVSGKDEELVAGVKTVKYRLKMSFIDKAGVETPFKLDGKEFISKNFSPSDGYVFFGGVACLHSDGQTYYFKADGQPLGFTPKYIPTEGKMIFWDENKPQNGINVTDMTGQILFSVSGKADTYGYRTTRIYPFNQGLALADIVKLDANGYVLEYGYGFINTAGKFVTPPHYREFYRSGSHGYKIFNDGGLASVSKNGLYGAVDKHGNPVIPFAYDKLFTFQEGMAPFYKDGKWGAIDIYGTVVIDAKYSALSRFNSGFAIAHDGKKALLIDRNGVQLDGNAAIDLSAYVEINNLPDGSVQVHSNAPDNLLIVNTNGKYGYTKVTFTPSLPTASQLDQWAWAEVSAAITTGLVPNELQNMYREKITREDFAFLLCTLLEKAEKKPIEQIVLDKTGKSLDNFISSYPFDDCYQRNVIAANALGLISGNGKGGFAPNDDITRQDAAMMLGRCATFLGLTAGGQADSLTDLDTAALYAVDSIQTVQKLGVMKGAAGNFNPRANYTRQEAYITAIRLFERNR